MKVSIVLITYNHEKYISQAIESILMQKFSETAEILIANDFSTDHTLDIIRSYEPSSPFPFRYCESNCNVGLVRNYQNAFNACNSEYIAVLEGDDYWTDPYKLQKHVEFLDCHHECVMSYNRYISFFQEKNIFPIFDNNIITENKYITAQQLAAGNWIGNFSTCVYRKSILDKLDPSIYDMEIADWMVNLSVAQFGLIAQIGEVMSVYRIHENGTWSKMNYIAKLNEEYRCAENYNKFFHYKYNTEFKSLQQYLQSEIDKQNHKIRLNIRLLKRLCPPIILWLIKLVIPRKK
jgi:Glycosyltransferases involved in cell wall biogenesis